MMTTVSSDRIGESFRSPYMSTPSEIIQILAPHGSAVAGSPVRGTEARQGLNPHRGQFDDR